jgi:3',5'-cyclic AMP phosphodiesterase CpdA
MGRPMERRSFLRISVASLGLGALYRVAPALAAGGAADVKKRMAERNGEGVTPFSFVQLSDTHVGFQGPPNPNGTRAFERAVEIVNGMAGTPELILFTGDLTHDSEVQSERIERMQRFKEIAGRLKVKVQKTVPGEHDAGIDGGVLYREMFGETTYSFDHRGVHFIALDNVSRPKPEVGPERISWLKKDLARFSPTAPIVVLTHRPLFDLKPDWEWFTRDGDAVMNALAPYENVTVLYGHIHREDLHVTPHSRHYAARSLAYAFPDPTKTAEKKPNPFDKEHPFRNLGLRALHASPGSGPSPLALGLDEVELTMRETSGTEGFQQLLKPSTL